MSGARSFVRPPARYWWARRPYRAYTLRYALVLLGGVIALARGRSAFDAWRDFLAGPWSLALHAAFLAAMAWHAWTWFRIMPKTMPRLVVGGRHLPHAWITAIGVAVATLFFVAMLLAALWSDR
jgi:fumarate reductase subunit C